MKTLKNRVLSGAMAGVLAMSLAVPAFASGTTTTPAPKNQTVITGAYAETDIDVTVPTNATAVINPYGLGVTAEKDAGGKVQITGQIMTAPQTITNQSNMKLKVGASVIATINEKSTMKLAAATTKGSGTEGQDDYVAPATSKSAFVKLDVVQAPANVIGADADAIHDLVIDAYAADATWTGAKSVVVSTKAATGEDLATLNPATMDSSGDFQAYAAGSVALFRLSGDCVTSPKDAWTTDDGFTTTVAFTFAPDTTSNG